MKFGSRQVQKLKTSLYVNLPKTWADSNDVGVGDTVELESGINDGTLSVRKMRRRKARQRRRAK